MAERQRPRRGPIGHDDIPDETVLGELRKAFGDPPEPAGETPGEPGMSDNATVADTPAPAVAETVEDAPDETIVDAPDVPDETIVAAADAPAEPTGAAPVTDAARARSTVVIDAQLPDPVYFGEDDTPSPLDDRSTVVIDDDASADAMVTHGTSGAVTMDPRVHLRRISVRRAAGRRRLRWVAAGVAVVLVVLAVLATLGSSLFAIDRVEVSGVVYTDPEALQAIVDDLEGTPVLTADTNSFERRLEAISWVEEARVRTDFPDRATIDIRERVPVATFAGADGRFRVIDAEGRVLDVLAGRPVAYMLVVGPDPPLAEAGEFTPPGYAAAGALVEALPATIRSRTEQVKVTADGSELRLVLAGAIDVRLGDATNLLDKLVRLETVLRRRGDTPTTAIDVSTAEVTVR